MCVKTRQCPKRTPAEEADAFPDAASLAALRAWYEGVPARDAVEHYLDQSKVDGQSARGILGCVRRRLVDLAKHRHRHDLAAVFGHAGSVRSESARAVLLAIDQLRASATRTPLIGDDVADWLAPRPMTALKTHGIDTLAALTLRIPRRRRWWAAIPGLGATGARQIEAFFAEHPQLTERARALVPVAEHGDIAPWESLVVPAELDGSRGTFRAPPATCTLAANDDYQAANAWLGLHEAPSTVRSYRKEAERLVLWAIVERGRALSSLTTEDAVAYRGFLRHPTPRGRWIGPPRPRTSAEWRPFAGGLSARSAAYSLSVIGAMYRWLIQQRYVLANPFAGIKVRGTSRAEPLAAARVFSEAEWSLIQTVAEGLEWSYGWTPEAAQRLRFVLDFAYATGLRVSELVGASLGQIEVDAQGNRWLHVLGKGSKAGKVALPPLARSALDKHLAQRGLPTTPARWNPNVPLVSGIGADGTAGISATRLWSVMRRLFSQVADLVEERSPATAEKLRRASPHWMRHTHASHALARGAELTTVRDNLRHASLSTTSIYLHGDDAKRARQLGDAFAARKE